MLDQLFDLVKHFGQKSVVENPDVPNDQNEEVLAEATKTIGSGFQNVMAGGGFQNILDLFKGGSNKSGGGGIGGLLKNPIVTMMVGYFINKLVGKFKMSPAAASGVSNNLIPNVLNRLISRTASTDPKDDSFDFNDLIGSLTGGKVPTSESKPGGFNFQSLLNKLIGGGNSETNGDESNLQDIIGQVTNGTQEHQGEQAQSGGLMGLIKGLMAR
ncbi:MAG: hypothetical protein ABJA85_00915 [Bacteroidota bacterium]